MNTAESKKLVQAVGAICSAIGTGHPTAPAAVGLAYALAELAKTPEQVQKIADAAARVLEREKGES